MERGRFRRRDAERLSSPETALKLKTQPRWRERRRMGKKRGGAKVKMVQQRPHKQQQEPQSHEERERGGALGGEGEMAVSGERAEVMMEENRVDKMAAARRADGLRVREAGEQIRETVTKAREAIPSKKLAPPTTIHGDPRLSKDELAFRRVFETMALSTLHTMDKIHRVNRVNDTWSKKAEHVMQMKEERVRRKQKIEEARRKTKEVIENWRASEENAMAKMREENARRQSEQILSKSLQRSEAHRSKKRTMEDRAFVTEFSQHGTNIGREQAKEDRTVAADERVEEIRDQVQQHVEEARRRRDAGKAEREIRAARLTWEGVMAKRELDAKMVEVCCIE